MLLGFLFSFSQCTSNSVNHNGVIVDMLVNGIKNPIGYDLSSISLSWIVENTTAKKSISSRVLVSKKLNFDEILHDSHFQENISSLDYSLRISLQPRTRYYWKVHVKLDNNEIIKSNSSYFETGKLSEKWTGKFISTSLKQEYPPYIRRKFFLNSKEGTDKEIANARVYISALGLYELYINNKKVSNEHFTPFCNGYKFWLQYQTFDVTSYLVDGENVIGVMLGDGWAKGRFWFSSESADMTMKSGKLGNPINIITDKYLLICELHIEYKDGTKEIINSDSDEWKCQKSPILLNNLYDGEIYDANYEIENWCSSKLGSDKGWKPTIVINDVNFNLVERLSPPVVVKHLLTPKAILEDQKSKCKVIDMGQNIAGWIELTINAPKDSETILEFGEIYHNGKFINENLRTAKQQFRIISNGQKMRIRPHFTFFGFQYIKLSQFYGDIDLNDIIGCSIYSDLEETGYFHCGIESVNKFYSNGFWSQRDNFLDVPTDCPQRDERMGWTGDAQVFCSTAMFNMKAYPFYRKYLKDLYLLQKESHGIVSSIVPFFGEDDNEQMAGRVGWADAATVIPFKVYEHTGRKQILEDQYESMKMWVDFVMGQLSSDGLWEAKTFHFGDWLALDGEKDGNVGGTELSFICSCYFSYSLQNFINVSKVLNKDCLEYEKQLEKTIEGIRNEYVTNSGRVTVHTQTAQALSLYLNISTDPFKVLQTLKLMLRNNAYKLTTGFIGTPILCRVLSDMGDSNTAYNVFLDDDFPGWLFEVKMNATSIWERWDSITENGKIRKGMNSMNHYASASVIEWFYRNICGIKPVFWAPGFKEFELSPQPDFRMKNAEASVNSAMGKIKSEWKIDNNNITHYKFKVPFDSKAHLKLRNCKKEEVKTVNGEIELFQKGDSVEGTLLAGEYSFLCPYQENIIEIEDRYK
ncbi:alpha-L-rhamnosidase [Tritrichomonas foetus]|uniref:alpha-L-rhamnosidase n=1 Tax=Tritrichomonas foetus TaxID=1144522 RepID=A0A1J4K300_9EUKA|nr:alpha-L-rhamnosidase [Tritrichomonas foetus]|eukprot:OHT05571.1 alpha-L-rhamnosidase [Tritrichomonas foetus]